ncbi:MAG TPA: alpha/beta hydrolase [Rhizomicrobium sp.]
MRQNETMIGHTQHGSGPEHVLVIHDWNGDHSNYDPVLAYLDGDAFTYAFVDLRGYGKSRDITGDYTVGEISRDCLGLADRLGWQRFHVVGHSMTGMATQRIAADAPARVKSAIAVCPMSAAGSPAPEEALKFFASTTTSDDAFRRLITFVSGGLSGQWAEAKLRQNRATVNPACRAGYLAMFSRTNFVDEVRGLATPFLVVVGDHDPGIDAAAMQQTFLAWHPNAELSAIPNCGHYPMQECPPYFATAIENFLRKHSG